MVAAVVVGSMSVVVLDSVVRTWEITVDDSAVVVSRIALVYVWCSSADIVPSDASSVLSRDVASI